MRGAGAGYQTASFRGTFAVTKHMETNVGVGEESEGCTRTRRRNEEESRLRDPYQLLLSCQGFRHLEASATSQRRPPAAGSRPDTPRHPETPRPHAFTWRQLTEKEITICILRESPP